MPRKSTSRRASREHKSLLHEEMPEIASWLLIFLFVAITVMGSSILANEGSSVEQSAVRATVLH